MIASHRRKDESLCGLQAVMVIFCLPEESWPFGSQFQPLDLWPEVRIFQEDQVALLSAWRICGLKRGEPGNQYFRLQCPASDS